MLKSFVRSHARVGVLLLGVVALAACSDNSPLAPSSGTPSSEIALSRSAATSEVSAEGLLACPSTRTLSASKVISARGGFVTAGGSALVVPPGAVKGATRFTITVPASRYMEVDISAAGREHYTFQSPVYVSISYERCAGQIDASTLSAAYIDTDDKRVIQWMESTDERLSSRVTFQTGHLSGYALATRAAEGRDSGEDSQN